MIEEISIRDLGVIAEAKLPLGRGFTAITGETGAGKTMLVSALLLLLGKRSDAAAVRTGSDQAVVDGVCLLPASGRAVDLAREAGAVFDDDGPGSDQFLELFLSRTVSANGRSRANVSGRGVPVSVLGQIASELLVVHGQSDQLRLTSRSAQRDVLDRFAGPKLAAVLERYRAAFTRRKELATQLAELEASRESRVAEAEALRLDLERIEQLDPQPGEDVALAQLLERFGEVDRLRASAGGALAALSGDERVVGIRDHLAQLAADLERNRDFDDRLGEFAAALNDLNYRATDAANELSAYLSELEQQDPGELAAAGERLAQLQSLARLHGSVDAAIELLASGSERLFVLDQDDERLASLRLELADLDAQCSQMILALRSLREDAAARLGAAVTAQLRDLELGDASFEVSLTPSEPSIFGGDQLEFMLRANPQSEPRPVAKSASGGELSRIMLAVEVVIAASSAVPTFVFDEIDAGIGGATAISVGRALAKLAESAQVIVVTHLAQVAAFADNHLSVVKDASGRLSSSSVQQLRGAEREREVARLLSGLSESDLALEHARELLALKS